MYDKKRLGFVGRAIAGLRHFAFAVADAMDYPVTWNCAHIANGEMIRGLLDVNAGLNRFQRGSAVREDPIVKETRLARATLFAGCDEDLDKLMDRLRPQRSKTEIGSS